MALLHSLFDFRSRTSRTTAARRPLLSANQAGSRLRVEGLEDRYLLSAYPLMDLNPGAANANPVGSVRHGDHLYFFAYDGARYGLFRTDGTSSEFVSSAQGGISVPEVKIVNNNLYYTAQPAGHLFQIFKVDLTTGSSVQIAGASGVGGYVGGLTVLGDRIAFRQTLPMQAGNWRRVITHDGFQNTVVYEINVPQGTPGFLTAVGGTLFFAAGNPVVGTELYKSDGVNTATLVRNINTTASGASSSPRSLTNVGGLLYFNADDGVHGRELWVSDGTLNGTQMVADIRPGPLGSDPQNIIAGEETYALFSADDGVHGRELWVTPWVFGGGPHLIKDINPGPNGSNPEQITDVSGYTFFTADNGTHGRELWFSDWLEAGTFLLKDINPGAGSSTPLQLTSLYGYFVYFSADDGSSGRELYVSDWTPDGTIRDADINPGPASSDPRSLVEMNGYIYFAAANEDIGRELFIAAPWIGPGGGPGSAPGGGSVLLALDTAADAAQLVSPNPVLPTDMPRKEAQPDASRSGTVAEEDLVVNLLRRKDRVDRLFTQNFNELTLPPW